MDEIALIEEIESSINSNKYLEMLDRYENKLIDFLKQYSICDIFILINRTIIFHNYNMECRIFDYISYDRNKHMSLKMLLNLPLYYYKNIQKAGNKRIDNYEDKLGELINHLMELKLIYYYYPCRNMKKYTFDKDMEFYRNYFKAYYFDFPEMKIDEFKKFIYDNEEICKRALMDDNILKSLSAAYFLQCFEDSIYKQKKVIKYLCRKIFGIDIRQGGILFSYPETLVKFLFWVNKFDYNYFVQKYIYDLGDERQSEYIRMIDAMRSNANHIGMKNADNLFFPRNYYWIYRWYNNVWRSSVIGSDTSVGKTYKSEMHEKEVKELLDKFFGKENVYYNVYLKRKKGQFAEKDFIVLYNDYVISLEAKSKLVPEPCLDVEDGIDEIKFKYNDSIKKAVSQGREIREAIAQNKAIFYESSKNHSKVVLDLNEYSENNFIQIAIVYEEFLNIETNLECIEYDGEINFWLTDVKSLRYILEDTVAKGRTNKFIEYVIKRMNVYGLINIQSGEEIEMYNMYKQFPVFFEKKRHDIGLRIHI